MTMGGERRTKTNNKTRGMTTGYDDRGMTIEVTRYDDRYDDKLRAAIYIYIYI